MKKILFGFAAFALAIATVPMFAAFEAHVINVTAKIENALSVTPSEIKFGTVFPEEVLHKPVVVTLSESFSAEGNADDVNYIIRQKPKCAITSREGTVVDLGAGTATGHPKLDALDKPFIDCGQPPRPLATDDSETWGPLPSLCPYLSKHPDIKRVDGGNDGSLDSFHDAYVWSNKQLVWTDVLGRLAKSEGDTLDTWDIDLSVPCFKGQCAQDEQVPAAYELDPALEHKVFGCDLWVEVTGVSRCPAGQVIGAAGQCVPVTPL